jgi:hypothetical protein
MPTGYRIRLHREARCSEIRPEPGLWLMSSTEAAGRHWTAHLETREQLPPSDVGSTITCEDCGGTLTLPGVKWPVPARVPFHNRDGDPLWRRCDGTGVRPRDVRSFDHAVLWNERRELDPSGGTGEAAARSIRVAVFVALAGFALWIGWTVLGWLNEPVQGCPATGRAGIGTASSRC